MSRLSKLGTALSPLTLFVPCLYLGGFVDQSSTIASMAHLGLGGSQTAHLAALFFHSSVCVNTFPLGLLEIPRRVLEKHSKNGSLAHGPVFKTLEPRLLFVCPRSPFSSAHLFSRAFQSRFSSLIHPACIPSGLHAKVTGSICQLIRDVSTLDH